MKSAASSAGDQKRIAAKLRKRALSTDDNVDPALMGVDAVDSNMRCSYDPNCVINEDISYPSFINTSIS